MKKTALVLLLACATVIGGCETDGSTVVDVRVYRDVTGNLIGENRKYCFYRFPNGHREKVYRTYGYRHNACPPTITRRMRTF